MLNTWKSTVPGHLLQERVRSSVFGASSKLMYGYMICTVDLFVIEGTEYAPILNMRLPAQISRKSDAASISKPSSLTDDRGTRSLSPPSLPMSVDEAWVVGWVGLRP